MCIYHQQGLDPFIFIPDPGFCIGYYYFYRRLINLLFFSRMSDRSGSSYFIVDLSRNRIQIRIQSLVLANPATACVCTRDWILLFLSRILDAALDPIIFIADRSFHFFRGSRIFLFYHGSADLGSRILLFYRGPIEESDPNPDPVSGIYCISYKYAYLDTLQNSIKIIVSTFELGIVGSKSLYNHKRPTRRRDDIYSDD
jgi:hypothetical protein